MASNIKVYSLDEVAEILQVTRRSLYTYIKDGRLPAAKIGKYWRVTEENLEYFLTHGIKNNLDAVEERREGK